jgi:hypothetical protein
MSDHAAAATEAEDLDVLLPNWQTTVAGTVVTVREFSYYEDLTFGREARDMIAAIDALVGALDGDDDLDLVGLRRVFEDHAEVWTRIIACVCDQPVDWVRNLPSGEANALGVLVWRRNKGFFFQPAILRAMTERAAIQAAASASPNSSTG